MTASAMKAENSRANFEAWVREEFPVWGKYLLWSESLNAYGYSTTNLMYRSWKASRSSVVVTLPEKSYIPESDKLYPDLADWPNGYNSGIDESASVIRAAGITVKGD